MPMHILVISSGYPNDYEPLDGIFYRDQAEALIHAGHNVGVISAIPISIFSFVKSKKWRFGKRKFVQNGVNTFTWTYLNRPKSPYYLVKKARKYGMTMFQEYIQEFGNPDIIHLHCYEGGEFARAIQEKYGIPYVVTEHSSRFLLETIPPSLEAVAKSVFVSAATRIAVSRFLMETLEKKYQLDFQYVPNIVDVSVFTIDSKIHKKEPFTFVHVAGLNANKNQAMLIEAFQIFSKKFPESHLTIVGDGPLREELEKLVVRLNLTQHIQFAGHQTREQLLRIYNESHAFVLTSFKETFGVVLIEAMSCGLPVIATKCGGPESIISESQLGELSEIDVESISLAMEKVYLNRAIYDANTIRSFVISHFSGEFVAKQLIDIYQQVTE
jgi:L-malate glycosyltransferase